MKRARSVDKMSKCLSCYWTVCAVFTFWSKAANTPAKRKSIHRKFIMGLLMARKERAMPNLFRVVVKRWMEVLATSR
jgi:hypothetical protein